MIEALFYVGALVVLLVLIPFVIFYSAKLGTYGSLRGKQLFEEEHHNDGDCRKEEEGKEEA